MDIVTPKMGLSSDADVRAASVADLDTGDIVCLRSCGSSLPLAIEPSFSTLLLDGEPTIHKHRLASDEAGTIAQQKACHLHNLFNFSETL